MWKIRIAVHANNGIGEACLQFLCLSHQPALPDQAKAFDDGMLRHVAVPFHAVDDVSVFIGHCGCTPIVPQPHGLAYRRLILTLALLQRFNGAEVLGLFLIKAE